MKLQSLDEASIGVAGTRTIGAGLLKPLGTYVPYHDTVYVGF